MMNQLNTHEYCEMIEKQDLLNKKRCLSIPILDDGSPLISLKNAGLNLIFEPSIQKDYAYLVRAAIAEKIGRISEALNKQDKTLIIRSAWRSFDHQRLIWDNKIEFMKRIHPHMSLNEIENEVSYFIAPETKSMHATGGAIDALIYDRKRESVMDFGTNKGLNIDLNKKCYPYHPDISTEAKENRKLLIDLFLQENFVVDIKEYWHFDYGNVIWALGKNKRHAIYDVVR